MDEAAGAEAEKARRRLTARPMRRAVAPAEVALSKAMQSYYAGLAKRIAAAVKEQNAPGITV